MKWLARLNPARWLKRDLTVEQFANLGLFSPPVAGVQLTPQTALGVSAVFCADRVIAEDLASLPMLVYNGHRLDDAAKPAFDDPVTQLLAKPNQEQTGPVFWSQFQHNANLWGFGLAEIARDGAGRPRELIGIESPSARIDRVGGRLIFEAPAADGTMARLDPADVLFLPGFSPNGTTGFKLLHVARMTLGLAVAAQQYGAQRFRNGLNPSGVIKHPGLLTKGAAENMRASWRALYGGPENVGVPMILEEGTDWLKTEIAHNDQLQLQQILEYLVTEVARFFNVSPVKLHQLGRATWNNLETLQREHVTTCLGPWIVKRDSEIAAKLLGPDQHCRHVVDRLLTADTATRFTAWNSAVAAGWLTPNEARAREDLPPKPGGDDLRLPLSSKPAAETATKPPTEAPNGTNGTDPAKPVE